MFGTVEGGSFWDPVENGLGRSIDDILNPSDDDSEDDSFLDQADLDEEEEFWHTRESMNRKLKKLMLLEEDINDETKFEQWDSDSDSHSDSQEADTL